MNCKKFSSRSDVSRIIAGIIAINIIVAAIVMHGSFSVLGFQSLPTDLNYDGKVDILDVAIVAKAFGSYPGHPRWNPKADLDGNNKIDIIDVAKVAKDYGKKITLKVALMVGGDESDLGFSYMAILGAEAIQTKYPWWTVSISKNVPYWNQRNVAAAYGDAGYDVVFCVGGQFMSMLYGWDGEHMPDLYNNTLWVMVPGAGYSDRANLVALGPAFQTVGHYLAGVLAAKMTQTYAVGWIVGTWYEPGYLCMEANAFIAGVHSVNSSLVVYTREVGGVNPWGDPATGKIIAQTLINTYGVDIIAHVADFSGRGVMAACAEAGSPYPMVLGCVADQWTLCPDNMLTSILMDTPGFMDIIVRSIIAGKFPGYTSVDIDLSALAPFHNLDPLVPSDVRTLLADTAAGIQNGTIIVPQIPTKPPEQSP